MAFEVTIFYIRWVGVSVGTRVGVTCAFSDECRRSRCVRECIRARIRNGHDAAITRMRCLSACALCVNAYMFRCVRAVCV